MREENGTVQRIVKKKKHMVCLGGAEQSGYEWGHYVAYLGSPGITCLFIFLIYYPHITISMS